MPFIFPQRTVVTSLNHPPDNANILVAGITQGTFCSFIPTLYYQNARVYLIIFFAVNKFIFCFRF